MKKERKEQVKKEGKDNVKKVLFLVFAVGICLLAGFVGSIFNRESLDVWYDTLNKPSFNPPDWVFGPVWTLLYILMGISLYLVYANLKDQKKGKWAYSAFGMQLFLNMLWSMLFFGLRSPLLGFVEIILLWASIALTICLFCRISKAAAWLLLPYILWVSFAAILNISIVMLN